MARSWRPWRGAGGWQGTSSLRLHAIADGKPIRHRGIDALRPDGITFAPSGNLILAMPDWA